MDYIQDLIYGNTDRVSALSPLLYEYAITFTPQTVMTLICDDFWKICEGMDNRKRYRIKRQLLNVTKKIIQNYHIAALATTLIGTDKIVILLDCSDMGMISDKERSYNIIRSAETIRDEIMKKTPYSVSIGISQFFTDINKTWIAYEESFQALKYIFFCGKSAIILYSDVTNNIDVDFVSTTKETIIQNLIIAMTKTDYEMLSQISHDAINFFVRQDNSEIRIKSEIALLLSGLFQYYNSINMLNDINKDNVQLIIQVFQSSSLEELRSLLTKYLETLAGNIQSLRKRNTIISMELSIAYMKKYYNHNLQLKDVAALVGYNPSYFSRIFSERYGKSFTETLAGIRIEEAKRMLKHSQLSIAVISEHVGYMDNNYFSAVFKKKTGISPYKYRQTIAQNT